MRDRLNGQPRLDAERIDDIVRNLNRNGGEHTLRYGHPTKQHGDDIKNCRRNRTGRPNPNPPNTQAPGSRPF